MGPISFPNLRVHVPSVPHLWAPRELYKEAHIKDDSGLTKKRCRRVHSQINCARDQHVAASLHFLRSIVARASSNIASETDTGVIADANKESASEVHRLHHTLRVQQSKYDKKKKTKLRKSDGRRYASSCAVPLSTGNQANRRRDPAISNSSKRPSRARHAKESSICQKGGHRY